MMDGNGELAEEIGVDGGRNKRHAPAATSTALYKMSTSSLWEKSRGMSLRRKLSMMPLKECDASPLMSETARSAAGAHCAPGITLGMATAREESRY